MLFAQPAINLALQRSGCACLPSKVQLQLASVPSPAARRSAVSYTTTPSPAARRSAVSYTTTPSPAAQLPTCSHAPLSCSEARTHRGMQTRRAGQRT